MKRVEGFFVPDYDDNMRLNLVAAPSFAGRGTYQFYLFQRAFGHCRNFRHAVDIGAHVGTWSYAMSRCFAAVTAFEPIPSHIECWKQNLAGVDNALLVEAALGDKVATRTMVTKPPVSLKARILSDEKGLPSFSVSVQRLDAFDLKQVDLLKIDTEGFELWVCKGGEKTIRQNRPILIIEQKPGNTKRYGVSDTAAIDLVIGFGARVLFETRGDYCLEFPP